MCLFRDVLICVGHGFDVAYFNQLKVSSYLLHNIYRDFEEGFCLCPGISFFIWSVGSRWPRLQSFSVGGGRISLIAQIWCDVPLLLNFSIGDLCFSHRSLDTFTLVFLSRFLVLWEWGPNLILKTPKALQHGKHLLWLRVWVFWWKKHNSYQLKWHKKSQWLIQKRDHRDESRWLHYSFAPRVKLPLNGIFLFECSTRSNLLLS